MEWHLISSEYPPAIGGVSDYTFTIAGALAGTASVHVWCPRTTAPAPAQDGVHIHEVDSFSLRQLRKLGRGIDARTSPQRLFVQWTPQGFGFRSLNLGFALWLVWRRWTHGDTIDLMVHEPYLRWSPKPSRFVAALVHRLMLFAACSSATRVWVSTTAWLELVKPFLWTSAPLRWLPLSAPAPLVRVPARPLARTDDEIRIGHFSMFSPLITPLLTSALVEVLEHSTASILLIGRGSDEFRDTFVSARPEVIGRVHATGASPAAEVHSAITSCDLMVQPYPDGVTSRRTSILTAMALAVPTVTNSGMLTEPFWRDLAGPAITSGPDGRSIGRRAVDLIGDAAARVHLAAECRRSYQELFDINRSVALLQDARLG